MLNSFRTADIFGSNVDAEVIFSLIKLAMGQSFLKFQTMKHK